MEFKEISIEEKYNKLVDQFILEEAINFTFLKGKGLQEEFFEFHINAMKNMIPSYIGGTFKIFKALSRGRAFKQILNQLINTVQTITPLSEIEVDMISDTEAVFTVNDCSHKRKMGEIARKAGLNLNPMAFCGMEARNFPEYLREFGVEMNAQLLENGCITKMKMS